ncbi:DedA family protein [Herbiconiux sp. SYSU D00978]|uniref:DedA family protein n=1 Tax=Herbiconiux sp. SYSU D00978 TaxID=2812562 RepID=UPI001A9769BB|nr:DedA family protein [Herbiconiux sp. SYSU D00978]
MILASQGVENLDGLLGVAARIISALGEVGVGLLTLIETVFPPIPSEVILPLAGFIARQGDLNVVLVWGLATLGAYLGALILYELGRVVGEKRTVDALSKLPLVDREDFEKASGWFHRHGRSAVFFGRLIPGVRSLISLPAGAQKMPYLTFTLFTVLGSGLWNGLLVGAGYLLGSQYELVDQYSQVLDYVVIAAVVGVVGWLVVRRLRRRREERAH